MPVTAKYTHTFNDLLDSRSPHCNSHAAQILNIPNKPSPTSGQFPPHACGACLSTKTSAAPRLAGNSPASSLLFSRRCRGSLLRSLRFLLPTLSMNRLDYSRPALSPGSQTLLKNSAASSASPRLRVEIHSLDLPLTSPLAQLLRVKPAATTHFSFLAL